MRERKYVKFRVDMYEDTKFKIIDRKPERDVIHYIWNRIVMLAGKVNLEGDLYLSKNIPYTIETLSIEFNRDIAQIKLALDLFIELEMIEITEGEIYRVKNFAKHQNIKVKEKSMSENEDTNVQKIEVQQNNNSKAATNENSSKEPDNEKGEKEVENLGEVNRTNSHDNDPIILKSQKSKKNNKKKERYETPDITLIDEDFQNNSICYLTDGARLLGDDETTVLEWSFG